MKENFSPLNAQEVSELLKEFDLLTFTNDFDLVYENHVPLTGIALIEGELEIRKASNVLVVLNSAHIIGIAQLLAERQLKFGCRVKANSKIILLGKSTVLGYIQNKKSKFFKFFRTRI